MFAPVVLLLATLSTSASGLATGPATAVGAIQQSRDPLERLGKLVSRLREGRDVLTSETHDEIRRLVGDARLIWAVDPSRANAAATALLDLMGVFLDATGPAPGSGTKNTGPPPTPESDLRDLAAEALTAHFEPQFTRWLSVDVLSMPRAHPLDRRLAAARLFETTPIPSSKLALLGCAREGEPRLRAAALAALAGWNDEAVHLQFLDELQRAFAGDETASGGLAERHFEEVHFDPQSRVQPRFVKLVRDGIVAENWRTASRAIALTKALDDASIVPFLIEALEAWKRRGEVGLQSLRIRFELQRALRERSGRKLGLDPDDWRAWWAAVRHGELPHTSGGAPDSTKASFFGLTPMTDRVVFVLDRSGSMETSFGPAPTGGPRTQRRWDAAVAQMQGFLEALGPKAKFDVVVFHDIGDPWKNALVPASVENLRLAREWLRIQRPNGGTQLRLGIERAAHVRSDGRADLGKLEADTVVILCDGETAEGPGWVDAFLEKVNPDARLVFDGVQVGGQGDGTLERLAKRTQGEFVHVDG